MHPFMPSPRMKGQTGRLRPPPSMSLDRLRHHRHRTAGRSLALLGSFCLSRRFARRRPVSLFCRVLYGPFFRRALLLRSLTRRLLGAVLLRHALLCRFTLGGSLHHDRVPSAKFVGVGSMPTRGVISVARLISRARGLCAQKRESRVDPGFRARFGASRRSFCGACAGTIAIRSNRLLRDHRCRAKSLAEAGESLRRDRAGAGDDRRSFRKVIVFLASINIDREVAMIAHDFLSMRVGLRDLSMRTGGALSRAGARVAFFSSIDGLQRLLRDIFAGAHGLKKNFVGQAKNCRKNLREGLG